MDKKNKRKNVINKEDEKMTTIAVPTQSMPVIKRSQVQKFLEDSKKNKVPERVFASSKIADFIILKKK